MRGLTENERRALTAGTERVAREAALSLIARGAATAIVDCKKCPSLGGHHHLVPTHVGRWLLDVDHMIRTPSETA